MSRHPDRLGSRRRFLAASLCFLASCLPVARQIGRAPEPLEHCLRELAAHVPLSVPLGLKYLQEHPDEASAEWLKQMLFGNRQGAADRPDSLACLRHCIATGRASDYRLGRLIVLEGWALPETDARLLALLSLQAA